MATNRRLCWPDVAFVPLLVCLLIALWFDASMTGRAQVPPAQRPAFEVASIKPHDRRSSSPLSGAMTYRVGRFRAVDVTVRALIIEAFRASSRPIRESEVIGGPDWIGSLGFDIAATLDLQTGATQPSLASLIKALLEDRFQFQAHTQTRNLPVYALVKARSDGRLGKQVRPTATDCVAYIEARNATSSPPAMPSRSAEPPLCDWMRSAGGTLTAKGITMAMLANYLSGAVDRPVVDGTMLGGFFDLELQSASRPVSAAGDPLGAASLDERPSIFVALSEQLALKLDSRQEPREVIVVDRVEPPTPD